MSNAFVVRGVERVANLYRIIQRLIERQRPLERNPLEVLKYQVIGTHIVQRTDTPVIQCSDSTRFAFETFAEFGLGDFQSDDTAQSRIARFIHLAHSSRAEGREDFIWS